MNLAGACPCGGPLIDSDHQVKTLRKALEWDPTLTATDLPIRVFTRRCGACGRMDRKVRKNDKTPDFLTEILQEPKTHELEFVYRNRNQRSNEDEI